MGAKHTLRNFLVILTFAILFYQCEEVNERYDAPPWFGGTNIETLEKDGNYSIFIALMDVAEYRTSIENQMFTLFVPNDSSFNKYFKSIGINSLTDLNKNEAEELFGQHILVNPRSREQLMYEYAWSELQDENGEYGTLFLRKRSYSVPVDYSEEVKYEATHKGQTLNIYREKTYIPLFTTEYFIDNFGDPEGSDYLFMYPGSSWSGTQWHDAMVTDAEIRTASGFIYYVDRVVAPIPTVDKYLKDNQKEFGLFYDLAQRFATYSFPQFNEQDIRRYRKGYTQIINFADERHQDGNGDKNPYNQTPLRARDMISSYIPYDNILQDYLNKTVFKYYESIDSVPQLFLVYLLQSHFNTYLTLPSKMEKRFANYYGDKIELDINKDIGESVMCSNGIIYAMNRIMEPNAFTCVPGPIFYNKNYTTFLYALNISGVLSSLTQPDIDVTLFAADNDELYKYGIRTNENGANVSMEIRASDGTWKSMDFLDLQDFVRDYIYVGKIEDFNDEGFLRMASDNYVYYNNGQIYAGGNFVTGDFCSIDEKIVSNKNGNLFYLDNSIKEPNNAAEYIFSDPDLTSFSELLVKAELIDSVQEIYEQPGIKYPRMIFLTELEQWTVLAPTNQAIADATLAGIIPEDIEELKKFIKYHFVRGKCLFDDGQLSGIIPTQLIETIIGSDIFYETLDFTNGVHNLSVSSKSGQTINIDHANANKLIEKGVLHKVNSVLTL